MSTLGEPVAEETSTSPAPGPKPRWIFVQRVVLVIAAIGAFYGLTMLLTPGGGQLLNDTLRTIQEDHIRPLGLPTRARVAIEIFVFVSTAAVLFYGTHGEIMRFVEAVRRISKRTWRQGFTWRPRT